MHATPLLQPQPLPTFRTVPLPEPAEAASGPEPRLALPPALAARRLRALLPDEPTRHDVLGPAVLPAAWASSSPEDDQGGAET